MSDSSRIDNLIGQSSLGTPAARRLRQHTSPDAVQAVLRRVAQLRREASRAMAQAEGAANRHDVDKVDAHLEQMVDAGHGATAVRLAESLIQHGEFGGSETWWRRMVAEGNTLAAGRLGLMLAEREEFTEAEIYLRQAAEACERNAARYLAELLMRQNSHEALIWWRRAAEEGDIEARQIFSQLKDLDGDDWSKMEVRRRHNRPHCKPPS